MSEKKSVCDESISAQRRSAERQLLRDMMLEIRLLKLQVQRLLERQATALEQSEALSKQIERNTDDYKC